MDSNVSVIIVRKEYILFGDSEVTYKVLERQRKRGKPIIPTL